MNLYIKEFLLARSPLSNIMNTFIQSLPTELYLELLRFYIYDKDNNPTVALLNMSQENKQLFINYMDDKLTFSQHEMNADRDMRKKFIDSMISKEYMHILLTNNIFAESINNVFLVNWYQQDPSTGLLVHNIANIPMTYELFCNLLVMLLT